VPGRVFNVAIAITGIGFVWVMFSNFTALLLADATEDQALLDAGVRQAAGLFAVTGDDGCDRRAAAARSLYTGPS